MPNICLFDLIFPTVCVNNEKKLESAALLCKRKVWIFAYMAIQEVYLRMDNMRQASGNEGVLHASRTSF